MLLKAGGNPAFEKQTLCFKVDQRVKLFWNVGTQISCSNKKYLLSPYNKLKLINLKLIMNDLIYKLS